MTIPLTAAAAHAYYTSKGGTVGKARLMQKLRQRNLARKAHHTYYTTEWKLDTLIKQEQIEAVLKVLCNGIKSVDPAILHELHKELSAITEDILNVQQRAGIE